MAPDRFSFLPDSTNAVEAHNWISKSGKAPEPLAVALMSLYKKDMVAVLEGLAEDAGIFIVMWIEIQLQEKSGTSVPISLVGKGKRMT